MLFSQLQQKTSTFEIILNVKILISGHLQSKTIKYSALKVN